MPLDPLFIRSLDKRSITIRSETPGDVDAIRQVNIDAFLHHPISHQTEHLIVDALRAAHALELSLVADDAGEVVGHIAFSPAAIGDAMYGWFLVGPVAVLPQRQGEGIGRALVEVGLESYGRGRRSAASWSAIRRSTRRFGFRSRPEVTTPECRTRSCCVCRCLNDAPRGDVIAHEAFSVEA